jgi:hypothetical protein
MASTLDQFPQVIRRIAARVDENIDLLVRRTALVALQVVITETPVDTGRARSNWLVTIGAPSGRTVPPHSPGKGGSTVGDNTRSAISAGGAVIGSRPKGRVIFITNNLPYIERLNQGWSAQAPAGYVEKAVGKAVAAIRARPDLTR